MKRIFKLSDLFRSDLKSGEVKIKTRPSLVVTWTLIYSLALAPFIEGCGYRDISTENGRLSLIQQANLFLNSANCGQARDTIQPLYQSQYVNNEVRLVYASAYACSASFSFTGLVSNLKGSSTSIFSSLVAAMYSNGNDSHLLNYQSAATLVASTTAVAGSLNAADRPSDANVYMIFMQLGILSSVISTLGVASQSTGQKTVAITGLGTAAQQCAVQSAIAIVSDSISSVGSTGVFSSLSSSFTSLCAGGVCGNKDPSVCTAGVQAWGAALIAAVDTLWI